MNFNDKTITSVYQVVEFTAGLLAIIVWLSIDNSFSVVGILVGFFVWLVLRTLIISIVSIIMR